MVSLYTTIGAVKLIATTTFFIFCILGVYTEIEFYNAPAFEQESILLSQDFTPSTRTTNTAWAFNGKTGATPIFYSSGSREKHTTIWECGEYGRLICNEEIVFRYAKPKSILLLKKVDDEVRIWDIKRNK